MKPIFVHDVRHLPYIGQAVFSANGVRDKDLSISKERLLEALQKDKMAR